ncbi:hypothetical protein [Flavobacterium muglaense]|uniref:Transporter n=1 Tax=Flavobacterium muglaense TaxID=2764716 RepID=A0A923N2K1_9FLAO|nr:hypothetical protein [Flavobacterium muglaense]MBC5839146.1 hypothetical protein [Flavobacterium muglaense]MBC5845640.1 hypothetical protein [Flavobacterium muglaense]
MNKPQHLIVFFALFFISSVVAQTENNEQEQSNIQNYTPSKLLEKGKIDIKWFNNLYTQTRSESNGIKTDEPRSNYFTTSLEVFTGVSNNKKINAGFIVEYRANSFNGQSATSVFEFRNEVGIARTGLSHIAPSIKIAPFTKLNNFSIQSSLFIPLLKDEVNANGYLGNKSYIWQNRFFYDYTFSSKKFQLFTELGTRFFFGKEGEGYANNSLELAPGVFLSYFPTQKFTVLTFVQHAQLLDLGNNFEQNYSAVGFGAKYQLSKTLNLETLYSKFVRGNDTGLGQSFNLGLRAIF